MRKTVDRNYYPYTFYGDFIKAEYGSRLWMPYPILPNLFVVATYQMILQDDKYYSIPQDKYSGKDDMHHIGYFVGVHTGYEINPDLQVGLRISRADFERDGSFGSKNLWEYSYSPNYNYSSTWYNMESRNGWMSVGRCRPKFEPSRYF